MNTLLAEAMVGFVNNRTKAPDTPARLISVSERHRSKDVTTGIAVKEMNMFLTAFIKEPGPWMNVLMSQPDVAEAAREFKGFTVKESDDEFILY